MLQEALELLQSTGGDVDTFVTDLSMYKLIQILTVHLPFLTATFLLSQEYLGEKIACFPPNGLQDNHAEALNSYCWNHGMWLANSTSHMEQGLSSQPHRFYPLYLPLQAIFFLIPIILWNIITKPRVLAILRGTERFLDDLLEVITSSKSEHTKQKAIRLIQQFHYSCVAAAETSSISLTACIRIIAESFLLITSIYIQYSIDIQGDKSYQCNVPELNENNILCSVPIFDLLDALWGINFVSLIVCLAVNILLIFRLYVAHFSDFQPLFYNNLPYGDEDDFNEHVQWKDRWTKHSYILLMKIFNENAAILTRVYILAAMQPDERKRSWKQRLAAKKGGHKLKQYQKSLTRKQKQAKSSGKVHGTEVKTNEVSEDLPEKGQQYGTSPASEMMQYGEKLENSPSLMSIAATYASSYLLGTATFDIDQSNTEPDIPALHDLLSAANQMDDSTPGTEPTNQESDAENKSANQSADELDEEDSEPEGYSTSVSVPEPQHTDESSDNMPSECEPTQQHGGDATAAVDAPTAAEILHSEGHDESDGHDDGDVVHQEELGTIDAHQETQEDELLAEDSDPTSSALYYRSNSEHLTNTQTENNQQEEDIQNASSNASNTESAANE